MAVHVVAYICQRGTGTRNEPPRPSRYIEVDAEDYGAAQSAVRAQLPEGWLVGARGATPHLAFDQ